METEIKKSDYTLAALLHVSTFSKYIIPLGNFIFPLVIWTIGKKDKFIDAHGRQALNFQISIFLYWVLLICATVAALVFIGVTLGLEQQLYISDDLFENNFSEVLPFLITLGIAGILGLALFILELVGVISATLKAGKGEYYQYSFSVPFIKSTKIEQDETFNNTQNESL